MTGKSLEKKVYLVKHKGMSAGYMWIAANGASNVHMSYSHVSDINPMIALTALGPESEPLTISRVQ